MTIDEMLHFGTVPFTKEKKTQEADLSLGIKFKFDFRPVNALDFGNFFKMGLHKKPCDHF